MTGRFDLTPGERGYVLAALARYRAHKVGVRAATIRKFGPDADVRKVDQAIKATERIIDRLEDSR